VVYLSTVWSQFPGSNAVEGSSLNPLTGSGSSNSTSTPSTSSPLSSLLSLVPAELIGGTTSELSLNALQSHEAWLVSLSRFLAGIVICSAILLVEKVAMQWVALSFHQTTYSDRIEQSNVSARDCGRATAMLTLCITYSITSLCSRSSTPALLILPW
jgi:hypothetical protein